MATMQMRKSKYIPEYDYMNGTWSMTDEEIGKIFEEAHSYAERGDWEGYQRVTQRLPATPNGALMARDELGKEGLLALGWNLADAEIAYGKNWLDEYKVGDDE